MATINIPKQSTQYDIEGSDNLYHVFNNVTVTSTQLGISEGDTFSGNTIQIDGSVSGNAAGVKTWGENTKVQVGFSGEVTGNFSGISLNGAGDSLLNAGTITGKGTSGIVLANDAGNVTNNGDIVGGEDGIFLFGGNHQVVSNGGIEGTNKAGILVSGADATITLGAGSETVGKIGILAENGEGHHLSITNNGHLGVSGHTIHAIESGDANLTLVNTDSITGYVMSGTGADHINNSGTILGVINTGAGKDVVVNSGEIKGWAVGVDLGEGNDRFVNHGWATDIDGNAGNDILDVRGASHIGNLFGGTDNDTYLVSDASTSLVENAGEGTDTVKSTVSYTLSTIQELENLRLLGSGDTNGAGNDLANRITGNTGDNALSGLEGDDILSGGKGRDLLTGGLDSDTFIFSTKFGKDEIEDFEAGTDHINLSHWNGVDSFKDMMSHHLSVSGGDLVIHNGADYLTLHNVDKSELHASDFSF